MAIFRGAGGPGDATTDAANEASVASTKAAEAEASATAAASSAISASNSATTAINSKDAAATSESNAVTSALAASTSEANAANSETNASDSESNAATSETNAANSASSALTSKNAAAISEANASTSETNSSASASAASTSAASAAASYDGFDDRYLGAKSTDPTVDNDNDPLITGALYFNTTSNDMKVYNGSAWEVTFATLSGALVAANNLSDVVDVASSRTNLGLGTTDSPSFAGLTVDTNTLYVDSTNNRVGIGTSSPTLSKLHIDGGDLRIQDVTPNIYFYSEGAVNNVQINANISDAAQGGIAIYENSNALIKSRTNYTQFYSANTERMRISAAGYVGIGESNPARDLHISNSGTPIIRLQDTGGTNQYAELLVSSSSTILQARNDTADGIIQFRGLGGAVATEHMRITSTGNVGIGTSSPTSALDVNGTVTADGVSLGDNEKAIFGAGSDLQIYHNGNNSYIDDTGTGNLYIRASDTVRLQSATGEQGVIVTTDGAVTLYHDNGAKLSTTATGIDVTGTVVSDGLTVDTNTLYVDSTNNRVGIGTNSPAEPLHVIGTIRSNTSSTGDFNFYATSTGGGAYRIYPDDATTANPTWLYQSNSSEDQAWVIGGVERMRIDNTGNVGIGTSSPAVDLDIENSDTAIIQLKDTGDTRSGAIKVRNGDLTLVNGIGVSGAGTERAKIVLSDNSFMSFDTGATERMRITSAGNVGIGTTSPAAQLDVVGTVRLTNTANASNNSNIRDGGGLVVEAGNSNPLYFYTGGSEKARITSSGNVGIGTTSPASKLHIKATSNSETDYPLTIENSANTLDLGIGAYGFSNTIGVSQGSDFKYNVGRDHIFQSDSVEHMRITTAGNVGIGTVNPSVKLNVSTDSGQIARFAAVSNNAAFEIISPEADYIALKAMVGDGLIFSTNNTESMRITPAGNVGIGTSSPAQKFVISESGVNFATSVGGGTQYVGTTTNNAMAFIVNANEYARIDTSGNFLVGKTSATTSVTGFEARSTGFTAVIADNEPFHVERKVSDGVLIRFRQNGTTEGFISVNGTVVSYNGGHLARWSQLADNTRDETLFKGTVMTNLDQMAEWTTDGVTEDNEQLNCMAVSSVEGDPNVAGVFVNWDNDDDVYTNDMNIAMTGDMIIRIAAGTTVTRGNLLMSAGDGTAKPQGDDIVRSKTIAKVTSTHVTCTYDDGSYCVPCVLMAC